MKINEITADPRIKKTDIGREDWDEYIGLTKKVANIKGYDVHFYANNKDHTHHYLIKDPDSEGFLGELKLDAYMSNYYQSSVFFDPEIQGKGLGLPLYAYVIKKGYTLVSDQYQSLGSREGIWKKLTQLPGIFVYAWDKKYDEFFQWNPEEDSDSEIYFDQEKLDKIEADYKAKAAELDDKFDDDKINQAEYDRLIKLNKEQYTNSKEELSQVHRFSDVRLVAIADKKNVKENFAEDKMGAINLDSALKNTPEVWQRWIMSLPKELGQEFVDERPSPDQEDIEAFARLKLTSRSPVSVSTKELLNKPWMKGTISRTPQPVVDAINKRYGTNFKGGTVYDRNPDRFFKYAQMPAQTAKPSVMVNGDIIFGVGRLVAALLRGDRDIKVWDLKESVHEASSKDNYGIPDGATLAQLDKIAKTATNPEKRERAHWLRNMRRGKNKSSK